MTLDGKSPARLVFLGLIGLVAAVAGFAAVYGTGTGPDNAGGTNTLSAEAPAAEAPATARLNTGEMATFVYRKSPEPLPEIAFTDASGAAKSLADFRGKTVLLNLWATWCAPCREEMPSLDRLERELGGKTFEVVALALDRAGADAARKFLADTKVEHLDLYVDKSTRSGPALKVIGMPTTILIDPEGREIGRLTGPAHWDSADAKRLIAAAIGAP